MLQLIIGILSFLLQELLFSMVPPIGAVSIFVFFLITSLPQAFSMVMQVIIYYNLRSIKEGVSASSLASVFG